MNKSNKLLEIIKNNSIDPAVFRANRFLISHHKEELNKLPDEDKNKFLSKLWNETFHANLLCDSNNKSWTHLEFFSEKDIIMFLMKWKS